MNFRRNLPILLGIAVLVLSPMAIGLAQEQPRYGGTFISTGGGEPSTLNPYLGSGNHVVPIMTNLYLPLVRMDQNLEVQPELAESWEISPDGLTYTFHLVRNATWHDGVPVTSADCKFSFETYWDLHPRAGLVSWVIDSIEAPDDYTLVFKLTEPYAPFLSMAGNWQVGFLPLPKHLFEGTDIKENPQNWAPIGNGPFKFKEWVSGSHIELVRNENYFKKGLPYLDRFIQVFVPDPTAALIGLEKGDIDYITSDLVPVDEIPRLQADPNFVLDPKCLVGVRSLLFMLINVRHDILGNQLVRQAIAYAMDKDLMNEKAAGGLGKVSYSWIHSDIAWAYTEDVPKYPYDPAKAETLLDQAGFPRDAAGTRFKIRITASTGRPLDASIMEILRDQLGRVGIETEVAVIDRATWIEMVYVNWDFDIAMQSFTTGPEPTNAMRFMHSEQIMKAPFTNCMGYSNPEVDALADAQGVELDMDKRAEMWHEIQTLVMTDLPVIPVLEPLNLAVYRSEFKEVFSPDDHWGDLGIRDRAWWTGGTPPTAAVTVTTTTATVTAPTVTKTVTTGTAAGAPVIPTEVIAVAAAAVIIVGAIAFYVGRITRKKPT